MPKLPTKRMPDAANPAGNDCYSAGERDWMEYGQRLRAKFLVPLLGWLTRAGISPDHVTVFAGLVGLAFVPAWVLHQSALAVVFLATHVLLDGLDGPLARHQHVAGPAGSLTDTFVDQIVVTAVTIAWMITTGGSINIIAGTIFVFLYALVVAIAMIRNAMRIPFAMLVRPRFFFYAAIVIEAFCDLLAVLPVITVCNTLLLACMVTGFFKLRTALAGRSER